MPIVISVAGKKLDIKADLGDGKISSSGKNMTVVSTGGFVPVEGTPYKANLIVIKPI